MPPDEHDVVEPLLAAHALATLEPHEAERVDLHLVTCASCRVTFDELAAAGGWVELRAHEAATDSGAYGDPPLAVRDDVLARARATPQDDAPQGAHAGEERAAVLSGAPARLRGPSRGGGWLRGAGARLGAVGALGVMVAALLVTASRDQDRIASLEQQLRDAKGGQVQVLDGGQFEMPQSDVDPARARVTLDRATGRIVFREVAAPPKDKVWQVWQVDERQRIRKIGVITDATEGVSLPLKEIAPDELKRIFITIERAGAGAGEPVATELEGAV